MKERLDEMLVGKKMEPRYLEYNWRDIILYALAVGGNGGVIRDGFNADLDEIRAIAANSHAFLQEMEEREEC